MGSSSCSVLSGCISEMQSFFASNQVDNSAGNSPNGYAISQDGCELIFTCQTQYYSNFTTILITSTANATCNLNDGSIDFSVFEPTTCGSPVNTSYTAELFDANTNTSLGSITSPYNNLAPGVYYLQVPCGGSFTQSSTFTIGNPSGCPGACVGVAITVPKNTMCVHSDLVLTATPQGGSWSVSNPMLGGFFNNTFHSYGNVGTVTLTYTVTVGAASCVATYDVTINGQATTSTTNLSICPNQLPYTWNGVTFTTAGTQTAHLTNAAGCDSAATLNLTVAAATAPITGPTNICPVGTNNYNHPLTGGTWSLNNNAAGTLTPNGNNVSFFPTAGFSGNVTLTYTVNGGACPTTANLVLTVQPHPGTITISGPTTICSGDNAQYTSSHPGGSWIQDISGSATIGYNTGLLFVPINVGTRTNNIYYQYLLGGCNYITYYSVNVVRLIVANITGATNTCVGRNITLSNTTAGGNWSSSNTNVATINNSGVVTPLTGGTTTITYSVTVNGCTKNVTYTITVTAAPTSVTNTTICTSALPYTWNGNSYATAGTYNVTFNNANGCDSIATLNLTTNVCCINTTSTTNVSVCANQLPYSWNAQSYTVAGSFTVHLTNSNGCDSAAILNLTINNCCNIIITGARIGCENTFEQYTVNTTGGTWSTSDNNVALIDNNGQATLASGGNCNIIYTKTINGIICSDTIKLKVNPVSHTQAKRLICPSQLPYTWNGHVFTQADYTIEELKNINGCDSFNVLIVEVKSTTSSTTNKTICSGALPYSWNGYSFNAAGNYTAILTNAAGCDSFAHLVLRLSPNTVYSTTNTTVCSSQMPYLWNGVLRTTAGTHTANLLNSLGCDSVATLNLFVNQATSSTSNINVCSNNLPYIWNGTSYTTTGTYSHHLINAQGCDSFLTLNLNVIQQVGTAAITWFTCPAKLPIIWNGINVTGAGNYTYTGTSSLGCDSIIELTVVISPTPSSTSTVTICPNQLPYWWKNAYRYQAGTYSVTHTTADGCDSIVNMNLVVNPTTSSSSSITLNANQFPYSWNNLTINGAGTYNYSTNNSNGCDSTATLNVTVIGCVTATSISNVTVCNNQMPYRWNAVLYSSAGTYTKNFVKANGCDSIATLNLTVNYIAPIVLTNGLDSCLQTNTTLSTTTAYASYFWYLPNNNPIHPTTQTINTSDVGTYIVAVTASNGCTATTSTYLKNCTPPIIDVAGDSTLCYEQTSDLTASIAGYPTATFVWTDPFGGNSTNNPISVSSGGLYTVVATLPNGTTVTKTVNVIAYPFITWTVAGDHVCSNATTGDFVLTMTSGDAPFTYSWTNEVTSVINTNQNQYNVPVSQNFTGYIYDAYGCSAPASLGFNITNPLDTMFTTSVAPCGTNGVNIGLTVLGGRPLFDFNGDAYYLIDGTPFYNGVSRPYYTIGTHSILIEDAIGCNKRISFTVTSGCGPCTIPHISIQAEHNQTYHLPNNPAALVYCFGEQITLSGMNVNGATYAWTGPNSFATNTKRMDIANAKPLNNGRYRCTASLSATCNDTAYVDVFVSPELIVTTPTPRTACQNSSITLTATSNQIPTTFRWTKTGVSVTNSFFVTNTTNGAYAVTGTNIYGCTASAATVVNMIPVVIPANITGPSSVCVGSTIQLANATAGGQWSSIAGRATVNSNGLVTGTSVGSLATIRYTIQNSGGCSPSIVSKNITVNAIPATPSIGYKAPFSNPQAGAPTGGFCVGKVFGVQGTPTGGVWTTSGCISVTTSGIATINTTGPGSLTYTFTDANGCSNFRTMPGAGYLCAPRGTTLINNEKRETRNDFSIFPNPAKSYVNLKVETLVGEGQIIVTDLYGKTVKSQPLSMGNNTVDIANLSKGMYFISTITSEGKTTKKLVVE